MTHFISGLFASLIPFAVTAILMTSVLKDLVIARPLAVFFAAEGLCTLVAGVLLWIHDSTALVMHWVRMIVMVVAAAYVFYALCVAYRHRKASALPTEEQKRN